MYEVCIMLSEFLKATRLTIWILYSINVKMNTRSFASLNIASETLKMEIENKWGRSGGTLCATC